MEILGLFMGLQKAQFYIEWRREWKLKLLLDWDFGLQLRAWR